MMITSNKKELNDFRLTVQNGLSKLNDNYTVKSGQDILRTIIVKEQNSEKRINLLLIMISENIHNLKIDDKRESIKILSFICATIEKNEKYISKLLTIFQSIITEDNTKFFSTIADTFGEIIENCWNMEVEDDKKRKIYDLLQGFCIYNIKFDGRPNQNCGCLCLSKLIGLCPLVTSSVYLKYIWEVLINQIEDPKFYAKSEGLETLVGLIFAAESDFKPYASMCLFKVLDFLMNSDWVKRKLSLDIIYALCNFCKEEIFPLKANIVDFLKGLKTDPVKQVREVCIITLNYLNENDRTLLTETVPPKKEFSGKRGILDKIISDKSVNEELFSNISEIRRSESNKIDEEIRKETKSLLTNPKKTARGSKKMQTKQITQKEKKNIQITSSQEPNKKKTGSSIFKGPMNKDFFNNAPKDKGIEIKIKENNNLGSVVNHEDDLDEFIDLGSNYINHSEEEIKEKNEPTKSIMETKELPKDTNNNEGKSDNFAKNEIIPVVNNPRNKAKNKIQNEERNDIITKRNDESNKTRNNEGANNNEILKQIKLLSERQIILIDTLENLQKSSSDQIKSMNSRIMELENLVMTISLNQKEQSKSQNIENKIKQIDENKQIKIENESNFPAIKEENNKISILIDDDQEKEDLQEKKLIFVDNPIIVEKDLNNKNWSEIELKLKSNNPNEAILIPISRNDKINLIRLIETMSISQLRQINEENLEECISKILNLLTKGEYISININFLKTVIINISGGLKEKVVNNIKDVINFLLRSQYLYNFMKDDILDMNLIISMIKFKSENSNKSPKK